jgi:molybdopterin synthase sulfur carrier subunit
MFYIIIFGVFMSITVFIPTPLRPSVDGKTELTIDNQGTLKSLIVTLVETYPKLSLYLIDDQGNLRKFVNFYINDTDIRDLQGDQTTLNDGDSLSIVPAIAGGCR